MKAIFLSMRIKLFDKQVFLSPPSRAHTSHTTHGQFIAAHVNWDHIAVTPATTEKLRFYHTIITQFFFSINAVAV